MIDTAGHAELQARHPFLYHLVWNADEAKLASITEHGLERIESHYQDHWSSRPDHVYLGTAAYVQRSDHLNGLRAVAPYATLRIDVARLTASRIDPDEDHFMPNMADATLGSRNRVGDKHPLVRFHLPFPPTTWLREWCDYMGIALPSLGEWADQIDLGSDSAETRYSIVKGSIAYRGVVPPAAITVLRGASS